MSKEKVDQICKGIGDIRRSKNKTKGIKVLNPLSLEEIPTLFSQIKYLKVDLRPLNHQGKDQRKQLNVWDVEETIWLRIAHDKEVEQ